MVFRPNFQRQLSNAFDTYLAIQQLIQAQVSAILKHDEDRWRLRNACPPCTYVLEDEEPLEFSMLIAIDGNESLKCMTHTTVLDDSRVRNTEQQDKCSIISDMYLPSEKVDCFKYEVKRHWPNNVSIIFFF